MHGVGVGDKDVGDRWRWSRPDVNIYTLLVRGLAASLRVSDALRIIGTICRVGVSPGEEVSLQLFHYFITLAFYRYVDMLFGCVYAGSFW